MSRRLLLGVALPLALVACHLKKPGQTGNSASTAPAQGPAPLHVDFPNPPDVVAAPIGTLRRGINLGNGFDAPHEGAWGVVLSEAHFDMAKKAGLDHVRLPVRFSAHAQTGADYTIDPAFFQRIDWAVDAATKRGLAIIVDLHHYEELMKSPDQHMTRTVALWKQIATHYASAPDSVLFELLNEPCDQLDPARLNALYAQLIPAVRATNPTRTLIVDSYFWAAPKHLDDLVLPDDANLVVSFHMYQPILFTHQGAEWMAPEFQSRGIVFPGPGGAPAQKTASAQSVGWTHAWLNGYETLPASQNPSSTRAVADEFDIVTRYVKKTGRRAYLGEFGVVDHADPVSRENYLRLVRREAERRGFAWAVWDDGGRMQAMNTKAGAWVDAVARGLFTDQPGEPLP